MIAHRGASVARPENTLDAFALALEQGADMLELDLHRTRDGAVVVVHDAELGPLGGHGTVGDATVEEIRRLDAGGGARVPLLEEVLDHFAPQVELNLELKTGPAGPYPGLEKAVLTAVESRGQLGRILFSSFDAEVLERLRALAPAGRLGVLAARRPRLTLARLWETAERVGAEAVHPAVALASQRSIEAAHARGLAVYPFTVDDAPTWSRLLAAGADGIFTNLPDRLRRFLDSHH